MEEIINAQPTSSSNMKWIYISGGVLVLIILAYLFMGRIAPAAFAPAGVDVDRNIDGSTTYTNEEGSVTVGQGASMPSNWPSDAPAAYSGATILYSGSTNPTTGAAGSAVAYNVNASVQAVMDYYSSQLTSSGWTVESNAEMAGMRVIVAKKDTRTLGVYVGDAGNGTVNVTAGVEF